MLATIYALQVSPKQTPHMLSAILITNRTAICFVAMKSQPSHLHYDHHTLSSLIVGIGTDTFTLLCRKWTVFGGCRWGRAPSRCRSALRLSHRIWRVCNLLNLVICTTSTAKQHSLENMHVESLPSLFEYITTRHSNACTHDCVLVSGLWVRPHAPQQAVGSPWRSPSTPSSRPGLRVWRR